MHACGMYVCRLVSLALYFAARIIQKLFQKSPSSQTSDLWYPCYYVLVCCLYTVFASLSCPMYVHTITSITFPRYFWFWNNVSWGSACIFIALCVFNVLKRFCFSVKVQVFITHLSEYDNDTLFRVDTYIWQHCWANAGWISTLKAKVSYSIRKFHWIFQFVFVIVYENYNFGILHNKLDNFIGRDWAKVNYCLQLNESFERNSSQRDKLILFTGQSMT